MSIKRRLVDFVAAQAALIVGSFTRRTIPVQNPGKNFSGGNAMPRVVMKLQCSACYTSIDVVTSNLQQIWNCVNCAGRMSVITLHPLNIPVASHLNFNMLYPGQINIVDDPEPEPETKELDKYTEIVKAAQAQGLTQEDIELAIELKKLGVTREHAIMISVFKEKIDVPNP